MRFNLHEIKRLSLIETYINGEVSPIEMELTFNQVNGKSTLVLNIFMGDPLFDQICKDYYTNGPFTEYIFGDEINTDVILSNECMHEWEFDDKYYGYCPQPKQCTRCGLYNDNGFNGTQLFKLK